MVFFHLQKARGNFSPIFTVRTYWSPWGNSPNIAGNHLGLGPLEFKSQALTHWASSNSSATAQVFASATGSSGNFLVSFYSGKWWLPVLACLTLQSWRQCFVWCPPLLSIKEEFDFSVFSDFYLLLEWSVKLPSSLHVEPDMKSVCLFVYLFLFVGLLLCYFYGKILFKNDVNYKGNVAIAQSKIGKNALQGKTFVQQEI